MDVQKASQSPIICHHSNLNGSDNNSSFNETLFPMNYFKGSKLKGVGKLIAPDYKQMYIKSAGLVHRKKT